MLGNESKAVVINGDNYEVEIFLLRDLGSKDGGIVPIGYNNITYLEITNDLANLGYYGKIAFINYSDILEQLNILKASKEIPLVYFRLKSLSFSSDTTYDDIYFTAVLTQGQDVKKDETIGVTAYNFEDLYTFKLKTFKYVREGNANLNYAAPENVSDILKKILRGNNQNLIFTPNIDGEIIDPTISKEIVETGTPAADEAAPNHLVTITSQTSLYDAISQVSSYLCYTSQSSNGNLIFTDKYDPGIIKIENSLTNKTGNNTGSRKIVMFPLLSTINKFFTKLSTGNWAETELDPNKKYYNSFLTEKFNLSQKSQEQAIYSDNTIIKYELKRIDLSDVLTQKWTGLNISESISCASSTNLKYEELRANFEQLCTYPFASNLPKTSGSTKQYSRPEIPPLLSIGYGTNSVFKSFIFDNVLATFRVSGQPYRKPNRFIAINTVVKDGKLVPTDPTERTEIEGFWYIISVNHVFEEGSYYNDFECVKIYELGGTASRPGPIAPTPGPVPTPAGKTNGPGETPLLAVAPDTNEEFPLLTPKPDNNQLG